MPAARPGMAQRQPVAPAKARHETPPAAAAPAPAGDKNLLLLERAERYLAMAQFDKAIATAGSVLELEPGNRAARALLDKAKARQMDALRAGSSIE